MTVQVQCPCGRLLKANDQWAGKRAECRYCGRLLRIPSKPAEPAAPAATGDAYAAGGVVGEEAIEITEFLDPPDAPVESKEKPTSLRPMFEALLDPRSIHWILILGGGLSVLGLIVWLTSLGIFENKVVLAVTLGIGTSAVLAAGWYVVLRTRFRVAGQALTFLGCVVAPLNLWFYHAQRLITLEDNLWLGGVVCWLLYVATVYLLRDPLFMYAVEAGITLTVVLFLGELGVAGDTCFLSMVLMALGLISIHAERAFPPDEVAFTRRRFGMPLFWSGHVQMGVALAILLATQVAGWLLNPAHDFFDTTWAGNWLSQSSLLAGGLWLAGMYAYLYSDIVVRRVGVYIYLAAFCLILAEVTLVGTQLHAEGLIAVLALTALAANLVQTFLAPGDDRVGRAVRPLAMGLNALPILIGTGLHIRATSGVAETLKWTYQTDWWFVVVMLLVAVCNRVSAYLYRRTAPKWSAAYFFLSAAAVIVAAVGFLRMLNLDEWTQQAPLAMLIPIAYLLASRLWRGHSPERPLYWVAQTATAVILVHVLFASLEIIESVVRPLQQESANLLLGLVFAEAAVFYTLAAIFRRRTANVYLATAAACGGLWQLLGYWGVPGPYYTMLYAALGVAFLAVCRVMGIEQVSVYRATGEKALSTRGRGLAAFQMGNAILLIALVAAFLQGLTRLAVFTSDWRSVSALALTTLASLIAICLVPGAVWRRLYATSAIALAAVTFLTINVLIELSGWQKLEIFCVVLGTLLVVAAYIGRFRETTGQGNEMVTVGLWLGGALATLPLLIAVVYHRFPGTGISLADEIALLTITVLLLVTGLSWQIKSTTFFGGSTFALYLVMVLVSLGWHAQLAIGVYLAIGGGLLFAAGIALSVYREKLLELPQRMANREGVFRIMNWR